MPLLKNQSRDGKSSVSFKQKFKQAGRLPQTLLQSWFYLCEAFSLWTDLYNVPHFRGLKAGNFYCIHQTMPHADGLSW